MQLLANFGHFAVSELQPMRSKGGKVFGELAGLPEGFPALANGTQVSQGTCTLGPWVGRGRRWSVKRRLDHICFGEFCVPRHSSNEGLVYSSLTGFELGSKEVGPTFGSG